MQKTDIEMSFSWFKKSSCCGRQDSFTSSPISTSVKTVTRNGHQEITTTTTYSDGTTTTTKKTNQTIQSIDNQQRNAFPTFVINESPNENTHSAPVNTKADTKTFERECLDAHNRYRAKHGSPPLKLSKELCSYSAEWAKNLANRNTLTHRQNSQYGENLFMASGHEVTGEYAVKSWYDEIAKYSFGKGVFSNGTGHFTQVIWKNSTKLGIGVERRGRSTWVVCNYDPPGNVRGQFYENVQPPK